jgi:quinoprotein glucose dehydrogenase
MYNRDLAGTRFSPLKQITPKNVANLKLAWQFKLRPDTSGAPASGLGPFSQATPIVVDGVMYLPAGNRILALDPDTGKTIWTYTVDGRPSSRGVAYWPGSGSTPARIYFTAGRRLIGLNSDSGEKVGEIDMVIPYNSVPTIYKNLLIVGANVPERQTANQPGNTRAFDVMTGKKVWEFHSVPQPGEVGNETWKGDSWKDRTGVNNWGFYMTVDNDRGIVYTVFGSPASDYYGGDREGQQPVWELRGRSRGRNRKAEVVFPNGAPRPVGLRLAAGSSSSGRHDQGKEGAAPGPDRQGRLHVHFESRHRRADFWNRRKARSRQ